VIGLNKNIEYSLPITVDKLGAQNVNSDRT
jgi:hypothetical protein